MRRMLDALQHRGPDGEGIYHDELVTLGHRRLSIIDLAGGQQPLRNADALDLAGLQRRDLQLPRAAPASSSATAISS